ncbi:hypothetical protein IPJ91_00275 [bacterium]|nr:MAG: hypothetical protein IPJ91_00275 [bacterium]
MISVVLVGVFLSATFALFNRSLILAQKIEQQNLANQALTSTVSNIQNILELHTDIPANYLESYLQDGVLFADSVEEIVDNGRTTVKHIYKRSATEINGDNCTEGILEEYKYPVDLNKKPQFPICVQIFLKEVANSKNTYCYGIKALTKVSSDEVYTNLVNGILTSKMLPDTGGFSVFGHASSNNFGCQF